MAGHPPPYPPEFRQQIIELVRIGRTPAELAREFEPTATTIRKWVKQAEWDDGLWKVSIAGENVPFVADENVPLR